MAEGFLKAFGGEFIEVASAGSKPAGFVHPLAIEVMSELGIDISEQRSKPVTEFLNRQVDSLITVCSTTDEACPVFPRQVTRHHWPFDDPAKVQGTQEQKLAAFRKIRDEMRPAFEAYAAGRKHGFRSLSPEDQ